MATHEQEAQGIERRRLQNRLAQRRFRQRRRAMSGETESHGRAENVVLPRGNVAVNLDAALSSTTLPHLNPNYSGHDPFPDMGDLDAAFQVDFSLFEDDFCRLDTLAGNAPAMSLGTPVPPSARSRPGYSTQGRRTTEESRTPSSTSDSTGARNIELAGTKGPAAEPTAGTKSELLFQCRANGRGWLNALHIAAMRGNTMIVRCLLQQHMDPNSRDSDGLTPLMHASAGGGPSQVEVYDDAGRTPLHAAVDIGFEAGVAVLLGFGADPYSRAKKS
ncbi:hypothetical protein KVR01_000331 [Diaporthe batatas]|uniref:uncharacterized protein n=1 Tax=Diaporthe batatas TaxID=748121 RepID=UPI001D03B9FD|nr:uncharacterized protein KVR01_000331 [Diaporthe batatas]KAG8169586.1 hypothetical protein KVR01_000331 [Diaporthe batatas]